MSHKDLREFIKVLEAEGELLRIKEAVDWNEELGAVSRRMCDKETKGAAAPALMFEDIKGYPGYTFFTNTVSCFRRYALALGLKRDTPPKEIIRTFHERIKKPIKPKIFKDGPCKENIFKGDNVDMLKFPVPKWHPKDGHRYIGTFHATIMKDLDTDWVNWGLYRLGIHDKNSTGILIIPGRHCSEVFRKYQEANKPMPVAVAIGQDPTNVIVSAAGFPAGTSEVDMAGALRGEPVELVKAETCDLYVPATAEVVLEGEVIPNKSDELKMEGPLGEWTGYYAGDIFPKPIFHVKCVTHRNNPILTGSLEGVPLVDDNIMASVSMSALARWTLIDVLGVPGVQDVYFYPYAASWMMAIVSAKRWVAGLSQQIACGIWASPFGAMNTRAAWVIVVEEDVDPTDINQVIWSMVTRCDPTDRVQIIRDRGHSNPLAPRIPLHDRVVLGKSASSIIIDAGFPIEWRATDQALIPTVCNWENWPEKVRKRALEILHEE